VNTGGGGTQFTKTIALGTAHCTALDGHSYTATLRGAIFYVVDLTVCGGEGSASAGSIVGQADPILTLQCTTEVSPANAVHALSPQVVHLILDTSDGVHSDGLYPIA
jgi:hypothetical protein